MNYLKSLLFRASVFKNVFKGKEGQEVLKYLAKDLKAYKPSHVPGDPYSTAFNDGMKQAYFLIVGIVGQNEETIRQAIQQEAELSQLATRQNKGF